MCVRARVELIALMCYCALGGVRTWEGLVRVIAPPLKERLSVFKPAQHATRQKPARTAQRRLATPQRDLTNTHTHILYAVHTHKTERTFTDTNIPHPHQRFSPRSSDHDKVHLLSFGRRTIRWLFFFAQRASQFSPSLSVSRIHVPLFLYLLPATQRWCPVDFEERVVLRS